MTAPEYRPATLLRYRNPAEFIAAGAAAQRHYEAHGAILLEDCGIAYDDAFLATMTFPEGWKKIGTTNGITTAPIALRDGRLARTQNPLCSSIKDDVLLLKVYSEFLRLELGFKLLVNDLFPSYRRIHWVNCTFRFVKTRDEAAHLDAFAGGKPFRPEAKLRRLKFFLNVDAEPRVWNVGPTLADLLLHSNGRLGPALPDDLNALCHHVNQSDVLAEVPLVRVEIPPRGIVFANGATVVHQAVYGNRMVALEGLVPAVPGAAAHEWEEFPRWARDAGYALEPATGPAAAAAD